LLEIRHNFSSAVSEVRLHLDVLKVSWGGQSGAGGKSVA
jgi:hypothetical protein